jgi:hypothetical protein
MAMRPRDLDSFDSRKGAELDACFAAWPNGGPEVRYAAAWRNWQKRQTIMVPRRDWLAQFDPSLGSRSKIGWPTGREPPELTEAKSLENADLVEC